jgi:linoleoyl-CoA desaturase
LKPAFSSDNNFLRTVRARVRTHLGESNSLARVRVVQKASLITIWFIGSYAALCMAGTFAGRLLATLSLAFAASAVGFNIFHDSNHGALTKHASINLWISRLSCAALGASRYFWRRKHNVLHHKYPNISEWDDDVESRGFLRLSPRQPWQPKFRYQHLFFFLLYALNTIEWFFWKDFVQYGRQRVNPFQAVPAMEIADHVEFWLTKALYFTLFLAAPFLVMPAVDASVCLLIFHLLFSTILTFVFQLAHLTDRMEFSEMPHSDSPVGVEWAAHQMRTTANFATKGRIATWFTGGLNYQIEHHLFPEKAHTTYPEISCIVRQTAAEFGLPYHEYPTYWKAIREHYAFVRGLATRPVNIVESSPSGLI